MLTLGLLLTSLLASAQPAPNTCAEVLNGQLRGFQLGEIATPTQLRGMRKSGLDEYSGLYEYRRRIIGGELRIYATWGRIVRRIALLANKNQQVLVCDQLSIGRTSFTAIEKHFPEKPEINEPIPEEDSRYYAEVYKNGFVRVRFVKWTDCGPINGECDPIAAARTNKPPSLFIDYPDRAETNYWR